MKWIYFTEGQHMSKVASQPPATHQHASASKVPHDKIAMRAYEKWLKRGGQHGSDVVDWLDAEKELQTEVARSGKK
jgi:hypothetical protein